MAAATTITQMECRLTKQANPRTPEQREILRQQRQQLAFKVGFAAAVSDPKAAHDDSSGVANTKSSSAAGMVFSKHAASVHIGTPPRACSDLGDTRLPDGYVVKNIFIAAPPAGVASPRPASAPMHLSKEGSPDNCGGAWHKGAETGR